MRLNIELNYSGVMPSLVKKIKIFNLEMDGKTVGLLTSQQEACKRQENMHENTYHVNTQDTPAPHCFDAKCPRFTSHFKCSLCLVLFAFYEKHLCKNPQNWITFLFWAEIKDSQSGTAKTSNIEHDGH